MRIVIMSAVALLVLSPYSLRITAEMKDHLETHNCAEFTKCARSGNRAS